ncbi:MAG: hypothetical protein R3284_09345 [Rubricoccaceae bacterium]|nr:hypothetical protein [Rubricoccaceae bacterium]
MKKVDLNTLVRTSGHVVRGTVVDLRSYWDGGHHAIHTDVVVAVTQDLKQTSLPPEVVVTVLGGVVDGIGLTVEDEPRFSVEEDVLLFLNKKDGTYEVNCLFQGKYTVDQGTVVELQVPVSKFVSRIERKIEELE